ncbi:MAG: wax ester/triacylglycerol synthase family O-acyltransferase [Pseudomonadales bacterium]
MKQLGTLDSAFINLENSATPQHVGGLGIYDPSTAPGGFVRFKEVLASFEQRLNKLPLFRTRLVQVPGDIDRPYWVEDKNFDVEFHLRHISLPKPGDWRQLWIQAARLHARSLDMSRPLWEAYIIEGLDNIEGLPEGAFAMYTKMHHSLVDGAGGASFMSALHDLEPNPKYDPGSQQNTIIVDRQPSDSELLARALLNRTTNSIGMLRSIGGTAIELAKYGVAVAKEEVPSPDLAAPKTRFNRKVGPHRVAEAAVFELDHFKEIKTACGTTINDVALAIVGGALRRYLDRHGELPVDSLAASIPLNMRTRREQNDENNQVGSMFTELHTNIADPLARVTAVRESAKEAKEASESSPLVEAMRVAGFFSPAVSKSLASFWSKNQLSRFIPMNTSTVVTNVPGPNFPLYCAGAEMVRYHGLGLLTPGCGLFHTIFSSNGKVSITILADRAAVPDPEFYAQCLRHSFEEMYLAAVGSPVEQTIAVATPKVKKKSTQKKASSDAKISESKPAKTVKKVKRATVKKTKAAAKTTEKTKAKNKSAAKPKSGSRSLRNIRIPESAKRTTSSKKAGTKRKPAAKAESA